MIACGVYPRWTLYVQVMTEVQAENHYENPFDITKIWWDAEYSLIEVCVLEPNCNPENYSAAFAPVRAVQGKLFAYGDAQRYRLWVNYNQTPRARRMCLIPPGIQPTTVSVRAEIAGGFLVRRSSSF